MNDNLNELRAVGDPNAEVDQELAAVSTRRLNWFVIQFENGAYYGEVTDDGGFTLNLYPTAKAANRDIADYMEGLPIFYRVTRFTLPDVE